MSMSGYVVMFRSMLDSTIWEEDPDVRLTWLTMLFLKDQEQMVRFPLRVVAKRVNLCGNREENYGRVKEAMEVLLSPDSRSGDHQEFDGRRVRAVGEHFMVLNGAKYDEMVKELWARARKTQKQRARRELARVAQENGIVEGKAVSQEYKGREARFSEAVGAGEEGKADAIAAEGLPGGSGKEASEVSEEEAEPMHRLIDEGPPEEVEEQQEPPIDEV